MCFSVHKQASEGGGGKTPNERREELAEFWARVSQGSGSAAPRQLTHTLSEQTEDARVPLRSGYNACTTTAALYAFFPAPLSRLLETSLPEAVAPMTGRTHTRLPRAARPTYPALPNPTRGDSGGAVAARPPKACGKHTESLVDT